MAEVVCETAPFSIALIIPEIKIKVEIIESPPQLEEGDTIKVTVRVHNEGAEDIEVEKAEILEDDTPIWTWGAGIFEYPYLTHAPNIDAHSSRDFELWTFFTAPKMPDHSVDMKARMCCRFKGLM